MDLLELLIDILLGELGAPSRRHYGCVKKTLLLAPALLGQ
jgi:hypothetical protein